MAELNRIYIRREDIARSMYRRRKERAFTTDDVMRLHWNRQGRWAREWARIIIQRMCRDGVVERIADEVDGDKRRTLYMFTESALRKWNLHE